MDAAVQKYRVARAKRQPVNSAIGADYGFVGNPPAGITVPPFVAALGPWPRRAIVLAALAPLGFALVLLPWRIAARQPALCLRGEPTPRQR